MIERLIEDEHDRKLLLRFLTSKKLPYRVSIRTGRMRSTDQNKLQWLWASEVCEQTGDETTRDRQLEWKLWFGVPILRDEDDKFATLWSKVDLLLAYEQKLEMMEYLPVTSMMTSKAFAGYLDQIYRHYTGRGFKLTNPEDVRFEELTK